MNQYLEWVEDQNGERQEASFIARCPSSWKNVDYEGVRT